MLRWRLLVAAIVIAITGGAAWLDFAHSPANIPGLWLIPIGVLAAGLAAAEVLRLADAAGIKTPPLVPIVGSMAIFAAPAFTLLFERTANAPLFSELGWQLIALAAFTMLAFVVQMQHFEKPGESLAAVAVSVLTMVYIGSLFGFVVFLRLFGSPSQGMFALVSMIFATKMADTGAYTFGRLFGKKVFGDVQLSPKLSPKKTVEGGIGAVITAMISAWLFSLIAGPYMLGDAARSSPWWTWLFYGFALAVVGMVGDLAESLLKRDSGVKDSSRWLPGLGGVLDIIDSILFAAPTAYLLWSLGVVSI